MIQTFFTARMAALLTTAAGVAVLGTAYIFQYGFGYQPCQLCLYQRIPWWIAIGIGCAAFWAQKKYPGLRNMLLVLAGITLLVGAGLAAYHAGVEWKWWEGPTGCSGNENIDFNDIEAVKRALMAGPAVRCDEVPWSLFGLSMAGYNFLLSLAVGLYALIVPVRNR